MADEVSGYFDHDGKPISLLRWADLQRDDAYKFLERTHIARRDGTIIGQVITIWTGMDPYRLPSAEGPVEIFESMPFRRLAAPTKRGCALDDPEKRPIWAAEERVGPAGYTSIEAARQGHLSMVAKFKSFLSAQGLMDSVSDEAF